MTYSDFNLRMAREEFGLTLREDIDLFGTIGEVEASPQLRDFLKEWSPAALAMNTEKARSEMIIAPILMELVRLSGRRLNLFSGLSLDVDKERGLTGVCDYLLALSQERFFLSHPLVTVVEAKREDINGCLGQCVAAMVGARTFNERGGLAGTEILRAVTTGSIRRFLKLDGDCVFIDLPEYYLHQLGKILGILLAVG